MAEEDDIVGGNEVACKDSFLPILHRSELAIFHYWSTLSVDVVSCSINTRLLRR